tara:strand:+ start:502 stop:951 length:450 start_codon:yes stop_codon:yes gene_type:complete
MNNEIKSFYDLEQSVKQTVEAYIQDNREDITTARKEYIEDNGKMDGFFYEDETREASQTLANDFVIYYSDTWAICQASRFGTMEEMDYFDDAESQVLGCHHGQMYIDKCMTSIAYMIVERLCMEFFSEFLLVSATIAPDQELCEAIEAL